MSSSRRKDRIRLNLRFVIRMVRVLLETTYNLYEIFYWWLAQGMAWVDTGEEWARLWGCTTRWARWWGSGTHLKFIASGTAVNQHTVPRCQNNRGNINAIRLLILITVRTLPLMVCLLPVPATYHFLHQLCFFKAETDNNCEGLNQKDQNNGLFCSPLDWWTPPLNHHSW